MNCTVNFIKNWLKKNLNHERYEHSIGTAECAEKLAKEYGIDTEKAYLAGLVHDCAKCLSKDKTNDILQKITLIDGELENPKTHHAPVGAYLAKEIFGIEDSEILSSIRWHTVGKSGMTDFEKIIFIADKIETRTRPDEYANPIREALKENGLDKALFVCYKNTIKSLAERELTICMSTIELYNDLLNKTQA